MAGTSITIRDFRKEIPGELVDNTWVFPVVKSTNAHGKTIEWKICVRLFKPEGVMLPNVPAGAFVPIADEYWTSVQIPLYAWINVDSGITDGKIRESVPTIVKSGKNVGKKNQTNVWTQALRDALGLYNKQAKKATGVNTQFEFYPPMLAQVLKEQKVKPEATEESPLYVQRKYNGLRAVATLHEGKVVMYSRGKKFYPGVSYIKNELLAPLTNLLPRRVFLDGECYIHGKNLQDISGYMRREDEVGTPMNYMIYDCFIPEEPNLKYSERKQILDNMFAQNKFTYCREVETFTVYTYDEVDGLYKSFLEEKYEGAMLRVDAPYRYSYNAYHSKVLLKIKPTLDAEFEITGFTTGEKGKAASALMIVCKTAGGIEFPVTPAMELPDRIALAQKMNEVEANMHTHFENHWKGKPLIVYFDEWSKDKVPQRARTKMEIRTWE